MAVAMTVVVAVPVAIVVAFALAAVLIQVLALGANVAICMAASLILILALVMMFILDGLNFASLGLGADAGGMILGPRLLAVQLHVLAQVSAKHIAWRQISA